MDQRHYAGLYVTLLDQDPGTPRPSIAFCHGLFGQGRNWTTLGRSLSEHFRVALIDLPNHGKSEWTEHLSYPGMADQLAACLSEIDGPSAVAGTHPWTVVGHSMGGKIAMALALQQPELVDGLCVVDIAPVDYGGRGEFADYVQAMRSLDLSGLQSRAQADDRMADAVRSSRVRSFLLQNLRRRSDGWAWQMNLQLLGDRLDVLSGWPAMHAEYTGPVLWVAGGDSDYIGDEHAPAMRDLFPAVRTVTVKGARHWVHSDRPEVFEQIVRAFITR